MADSFVTPFTRPVSDNKPRDLLSQLYREIGISAVAAALSAMGAQESSTAGEKQEQDWARYARAGDLAA